MIVVGVHPLHFLSLDNSQDKGPPVPLVVLHKLIGFANIELQLIIDAESRGAGYSASSI